MIDEEKSGDEGLYIVIK